MEKKAWSKTCLIGCILSFAVPLLTIAIGYAGRKSVFSTANFGLFFIIVLLSMVAGLILSIIGVTSAKKNGTGGIGFGIAGIVLSIVGLIIAILFIAFMISLMWLGTNVIMSN